MNYDLLIKQAEALVSKYMQKHSGQKLHFHNLLFTQNVVSIAGKVAKHYSLEEKELFVVMAAAWFLNTGYCKDADNAEEASIKMAEEFLVKSGVDTDTVEQVKKCMLAASTPFAPVTIGEKIACDASTFYLGAANFPGYNKLRFREAELRDDEGMSKTEWRKQTILLLENHEFFTDYCISRLNDTKRENLENLRKKNPLLSLTPTSIEMMFEEEASIGKVDNRYKDRGRNKDKDKLKESKLSSAERTVETMFKTTSVNSQELSSQADAKANIMISVNTIVVSFILVVLGRTEKDEIVYPTILMLMVSLATIIFSILATRPNITKRYFTDNDVKENKVNMLFFGNFFTMDFDTYRNAMLALMSEKDNLHATMLRNLYEQGSVLAKKYKMLKMSYNVFMYGLVLSVIAFVIAFQILGD